MYKYPYGDSQQLNLDWILAKIKELEAGGSGGAADLEAVANALVTLSFNLNTQYRRYDYCFLNGKLYRCLSDTSGVFDPSAWQEALIGDDLAVLTKWINAIDAAAVVDVKFDTTGTNGKIQQKYHDEYHDVVEVDYTPVQNSKRPLSSNAGYELNTAISDEETARQNADIAIQNKLSTIGTILEGATSPVTVASGTVVEISSITLPIGNWMILGAFGFSPDFSQVANGYIMTGSDVILTTRGTGANGGTFAPLVSTVVGANNTTVTMKTYQESGSEKTAYPTYFRAIRIS